MHEVYLAVRGLGNSTYYNVWNGVGGEGWAFLPSGATGDGPAATILNNSFTWWFAV